LKKISIGTLRIKYTRKRKKWVQNMAAWTKSYLSSL